MRRRAHAHGTLQHPGAAEARIVRVNGPQRAPVQGVCLVQGPAKQLSGLKQGHEVAGVALVKDTSGCTSQPW